MSKVLISPFMTHIVVPYLIPDIDRLDYSSHEHGYRDPVLLSLRCTRTKSSSCPSWFRVGRGARCSREQCLKDSRVPSFVSMGVGWDWRHLEALGRLSYTHMKV